MKYVGEEAQSHFVHIECDCGVTIRIHSRQYRVECPCCKTSAVVRQLKEEEDERRRCSVRNG